MPYRRNFVAQTRPPGAAPPWRRVLGRRRPVALLVAAVLGLSAPGAGWAWAESAAADPVVLVQSRKPVADVSPYLTGSNIDQWFDRAHGLWDPEARAPDPDVVAKTRRAGVGMVRFPGGTPANLYDWKEGIGPVDERGCQADGRPNGGGVGPGRAAARVRADRRAARASTPAVISYNGTYFLFYTATQKGPATPAANASG